MKSPRELILDNLNKSTSSLEEGIAKWVMPTDNGPRRVVVELIEPLVVDFKQSLKFANQAKVIDMREVSNYLNRIKQAGLEVLYS